MGNFATVQIGLTSSRVVKLSRNGAGSNQQIENGTDDLIILLLFLPLDLVQVGTSYVPTSKYALYIRCVYAR